MRKIIVTWRVSKYHSSVTPSIFFSAFINGTGENRLQKHWERCFKHRRIKFVLISIVPVLFILPWCEDFLNAYYYESFIAGSWSAVSYSPFL